ncbi:Coenzyme F420 hydrogenase/dehydrogenase, beta subunit C-terminal domain [Photobacterium profundum]|uniref:Coenzyme F420 hydrogenase/dehydrogenase, beta subunit C-terminal domain n=1 Tax=Photobacterium profundum TaxID=74109 RepID=UPI003D0CCD04
MSENQAKKLYETVIANGYCVGCGACAVLEDSPFKMSMNKIGQYEAEVNDPNIIVHTSTKVEEVCPFSSKSLNEDQLGKSLFESSCNHDSSVGYYQKSYAGHVKEGNFRDKGSSGGFGSWVLYELLESGKVDYIINVQPSPKGAGNSEGTLFTYTICSSIEEIQSGSKSRYYPIELSGVMEQVRRQPGRYAVVGLPCFIKSVRLLQNKDAVLAERIRFCVGLVCGHLKSARYAQSLAWQSGIVPSKLEFIDFRIKSKTEAANRYSTLSATNNNEKIIPTNQLFGTDWGMGAFKYKACDFCDDVFAETADIVLGDAWLPQYVHDGAGTNILILRNNEIHELIISAKNEGRLILDELPIEQAKASQDAGLRHRKGGLGYRLTVEQENNVWIPTKRVAPNSAICSSYEKKRQDLRIKLRQLSHSSFQRALDANDLNIYLNEMNPVYKEYKSIKGSYWERCYNFFKRVKGFIRRRLSRY